MHRVGHVLIAGALLLAVPHGGVADGFQPSGASFQVNTYTIGSPWEADLVVGRDGSVLFVWEHRHGGGSPKAQVRGRVAGPDGGFLRPDFEIGAAADHATPRVAAVGRDFVVVWEDALTGRIVAQGVGSAGEIVGPALEVAEPAPPVGYNDPAVAGLPGGGFVVTWGESDAAYDTYILARLYGPGGDASPPFVVSAPEPPFHAQGGPDVASQEDGRFVVGWGRFTGYAGYAVARGFDEIGTPLGPEFSAGGCFGILVSLAALPSGYFTIACNVFNIFQSPLIVSGFSAEGDRGEAIEVDAHEKAVAGHAVVHVGGDIVTASTGFGESGALDDRDLHLTVVTADGPEAQLTVAENAEWPRITRTPDGGIVIVWTRRHPGQPVSPTIRARRLGLGPPPVFADGFETGGFEAWSEVVG